MAAATEGAAIAWYHFRDLTKKVCGCLVVSELYLPL
nr:MAG TPA: hypothetical protein [Caudoviricetes sp.]